MAVGLAACVGRSQDLGLESAIAPVMVTTTSWDLGHGQARWGVVVRPTPGSESWFERSAGRIKIGVPGREVALRRVGTDLEGSWQGGRGEQPIVTWQATDGSAGLRIELVEGSEVKMPRFVDIARTGMVWTAVPIVSEQRPGPTQVVPSGRAIDTPGDTR